MVIVMDGNHEDPYENLNDSDILKQVSELTDAGVSTRDAVKQIAKKTGLSKNVIYNMVNGQGESE